METKNLFNKKITQWLLLVAMLVGCSANAWAANKVTLTDVYLNVKWGGNDWSSNNARIEVQLNTWDNCSDGEYSASTVMTRIGTSTIFYANISSITSSKDYYGIKFRRVDPNTGNDWNSACTYNASGNLFSLSDWGSGSWSTMQMLTTNIEGGGFKDYPICNGSVTVTAAAGTRQFKVHSDNWYGCTPTGDSGCGQMTRENCSNWTLYSGANNAEIVCDIAGNYTFNWDQSGKKLSVTYPEKIRYYLKHPWNGGNWSWLEMTTSDGVVYTLSGNDVKWGDDGCNYNTVADGSGTWITKTSISGYSSVAKGSLCKFTFNASTKALSVESLCSTPAKPTLAAKNGATTVCSGSNPVFTITGAVSGAKYTLYAGSTSAGTVTASGTSVDITASSSISSQTIYKVKACSGTTGCESYCSDYSSTVTINVDPKSVAGTITGVVSPICSGSTENLTLTGSTGTIQWKKSTDGGSSWSNVGTGATTYSETVTAATKYKVSVKSGVCAAAETAASSVTIKTAPSKPSISGPTKICATTSGNTYTITGDADSYEIATGGYLDYQLNNKTITVTTGADEHSSYLKVTSVNCTSLKTASDQYNINIYQSAAKGTVSLLVDDAAGTSACMGQTVSASQTGFRTGGGTGSWSSTNTTVATVNSTSGDVTLKKAGTTNITYTISNPTCGSSVNDYKTLTVKGTSFTLTGDASSKAWKPVTLSTSPATQATWSVTPNDNGAYLSNITGTSSTLKAPAPQSSGSTSYTVRAEAEVDGCHAEAQKTVSVQYETCQ